MRIYIFTIFLTHFENKEILKYNENFVSINSICDIGVAQDFHNCKHCVFINHGKLNSNTNQDCILSCFHKPLEYVV
jgi:hypothetical protein